ncbi:MAG: nucleotidyltransferase domain-containing protein [Planctomycetota bacterium]
MILRRDIIDPYMEVHPWPVVFVTISGAHLYGFASPDSDYDLRGMHAMPARATLGLDIPRETYEVMDLEAEIEMDLVTHDARKFFRMLLSKNGYVLEQIFSPLVVTAMPEFEELKSIAADCITCHHRRHFRSFAGNQWRDVTASNKPTVKKLLYAYRPLLAGIHLMTEREVESNIATLNERFRLGYIDELVDAKVGGNERMKATGLDMAFHEAEFERLRGELEAASAKSALPEHPAGRDRLDDLLVRLRMA